MPPPLLETRRAIARDPASGAWRSFERASSTLVAWDPAEVAPVVAAAEAAAIAGRWVVGFVSYDAGPAFDPAIESRRDPSVPLAVFAVFEGSEPDPVDGGFFTTGPWSDSVSPEAFRQGVDAVRDLIAAGDTYQVNLTYRRSATFDGSSLGLFRSLMAAQGATYGVYLDLGPFAVCSASPELFLRRDPQPDGGHRLRSIPMKGTRPRGSTPAADERLVDELAGSAKDRAENTMIVDMMRNDLGRIAEVGSITVPALHRVERYPTVLQMTSTVEARSRASLAEVFGATFPPASITGAPKYRTTRRIAELEATPRGLYTGAAGVIGPGGVAEFNVAIRTVWIDRVRATATFGVGGGIVWDSDPADEWSETKVKTRVLDRALEPVRLLETMLWSPDTGIGRVDRHLARLDRSAMALGHRVDLDQVRERLTAWTTARPRSEPRRLRLLVDRNGNVELESGNAPEPTIEPWPARLAATPVRSTDPTLGHKTTARHAYDHHRRSMGAAREVILWNERGELTETTIGNLVLDLDGQLVTPPTSSGLLPGTFRAELLDHDKIRERVVTRADLARCDAIFSINSVRGWVELVLIEPD